MDLNDVVFPLKGHLVAADATLKSIDCANAAAAAYGRFSPAVIVPQHAVASTTTFQRTNQSGAPSPTGAIVYTTKPGGNISPRYVRQACATLPNNATKPTTDAMGRCYMTLNPELYEVDYPYGQLKYSTGAFQHPGRRMSSPGTVKSSPNIVDIEPPSTASGGGDLPIVEAPRMETQKRCRFKIDTSGSRPLLTPTVGNFDNSESTDGKLLLRILSNVP